MIKLPPLSEWAFLSVDPGTTTGAAVLRPGGTNGASGGGPGFGLLPSRSVVGKGTLGEEEAGGKMNPTLLPVLYIDATPDEGYVLRILRAYRENCNCRWAENTGGEEGINPVLVLMNKHQEERAKLLNKAIAILERTLEEASDEP